MVNLNPLLDGAGRFSIEAKWPILGKFLLALQDICVVSDSLAGPFKLKSCLIQRV